MWFYKFCYLIVLFSALSIHCSFVNNHGLRYKVYEDIDLPNIIIHNNIKSIEKSSTTNTLAPKIIYDRNGQKLELLGGIFIFVELETYVTRDSIEENYHQHKKSDNKAVLRKGDNKVMIVLADNSQVKDTVPTKGLTIFDQGEFKANMENSTSNILRDAFGDACIKVAVRKCFMALLAVNVNICKRRYTCKSKFRSYLKRKSKEGCIKEFDYSKSSKKKKPTMKSEDKSFVDATRQGYLDVCIPYLVPNNKAFHNITLRNDIPVIAFANELLRDRSDKKCQKLSRSKCVRACQFATKKTCSKYYCPRRKMKAFNKVCKEECRRHYQINKRVSDSSERSSGSD